VLVLKGADLLRDVGPRHLLALANVALEIEIFEGDVIYAEQDPADALYIVVDGRVLLFTDGRKMSEVGPGEAFGTWSLVDDSARGHHAECAEDGLALALHRDEFYDIASADLTLLQELVRVLAKRLRALVVDKPEEARVEGEGVERPEAVMEAEEAAAAAGGTPAAPAGPAPSAGEVLTAAALGKPVRDEIDLTEAVPDPVVAPEETVTTAEVESPDSLEEPHKPQPGVDPPSEAERRS